MKNGNIHIQFPDLAELDSLYETTNADIDAIKTEFIFYLKSPIRSADPLKLGFKAVSRMNNWWPSHNGESRGLTLYWMRAPQSQGEPQAAERRRWGHYYESKSKYKLIEQHLASSGCGLKIGEPPLKVSLFNRFFTLMRMPVTVTPLQKRWLTRYNYRHLDTGKLATYWINGWKPEEYSHEKEYAHFKTTKEEWGVHGMDGY